MMNYTETDYKVYAVELLIESLRPGAKWSCKGFDYSGLEWPDQDQTKPTEAQWNSGWAAALASAKLNKLRMQRNILLAETDWWANSDLTMTQAQTDYRQALRDITDTYSSLDDVVWPTKPS